MHLLIDENMPRSLARELAAMGFSVQDVRDIGLRGHPVDFTAGVIFVNLPDDSPAALINSKVTTLLTKRLPESLLGAVTFVEPQRALSRIVRRRPKPSTGVQDNADKQGEKDETLNAQLDETRTD